MALCALLLSDDEQAVHAVKQIFEELHFACEHSDDLSLSLEKIETQRFDVILVECADQQQATSLLTAARESALNRTSVTIALAEGKTGLPTAFRIGAELVLTKPVSLEQARSTFKTALAILRKDVSRLPLAKATAAAVGSVGKETASRIPAAHREVESGSPRVTSPKPAMTPSSDSISTPAPTASAAASAVPVPVRLGKVVPSIADDQAAPAEATSKPDIAAPPSALGTDSRVDQDELILAELEQESPKRSAPPTQKKASGSKTPLLAVAVVVVIVAGIYAAWSTQPRFRSFARNQYAILRPGIAAAWADLRSLAASVSAKLRSHKATSPATPGTNSQRANSPAVASSPTQTLAAAGSASSTPALVPVASTDPNAENNALAPVVLSEAVSEGNIVHRMEPLYPKPAQQKGVQGVVLLQVVVSKEGKVDSASVLKGDPLLVPAAVDAVKQWLYRPYLHNGEPTVFQTQVTLEFH